jgi:predicted nucleic acid-binding protein
MTERRFIDTNLVVRHLVGDHPQHARAAAKLFEACDRGEFMLILLPSVLSECVFVLESFYKQPRDKIAAVLKTLVTSPGIEMADPSIHADALDRYASGNAHFVDCTLAAHAAASGYALVSFDQDFKRFKDVKLLNPLKDPA